MKPESSDPYIEMLVREAETPRQMDIFDQMSTRIIEGEHEWHNFPEVLAALQVRIRRQQLRRIIVLQ